MKSERGVKSEKQENSKRSRTTVTFDLSTPPNTPQSKDAKLDFQDLRTPERPGRPMRVEQCRPAPGWKMPYISSPNLKRKMPARSPEKKVKTEPEKKKKKVKTEPDDCEVLPEVPEQDAAYQVVAAPTRKR